MQGHYWGKWQAHSWWYKLSVFTRFLAVNNVNQTIPLYFSFRWTFRVIITARMLSDNTVILDKHQTNHPKSSENKRMRPDTRPQEPAPPTARAKGLNNAALVEQGWRGAGNAYWFITRVLVDIYYLLATLDVVNDRFGQCIVTQRRHLIMFANLKRHQTKDIPSSPLHNILIRSYLEIVQLNN